MTSQPIFFEPEAFLQGKDRVRKRLLDCVHYHPPDVKKVCGGCLAMAIELVSTNERERCAILADEHGHRLLASLIRKLT